MKQPGRILKVAVLASSGILAAGFVMYRAGALGALLRGSESDAPGKVVVASLMPDSPSTATQGTAPNEDTLPRRSRFFGGSKSGVPMIDAPPGDTPSAVSDTVVADDTSVTRREVFMGGSKSLAPMIDPPGSAKSNNGYDTNRKSK